MSQTFDATFQDGVFKPDHPPALADKARVRIVVQPVVVFDEAKRKAALAALEQLWRNLPPGDRGKRMTRDELHERR